jgi:hypothetical protein
MLAEIEIEVAYALPEKQRIVPLAVPLGTTAIDAAKASGITEAFPQLTLSADTRLGIFGQEVSQEHILREGDRVEIYRPLLLDPKEIRRLRAEKARERRRG